MVERYRDERNGLHTFAAMPILVRCPMCRDAALVRAIETGTKDPSGRPRREFRLTCTACGYARSGRNPRDPMIYGAPVDPFFRAPLLLQAPCAGHTLWAYNEAHLDELRRFVEADHRERPTSPGSTQTMVARLPRWLGAASNRQAVLHTIDQLRLRIPAS